MKRTDRSLRLREVDLQLANILLPGEVEDQCRGRTREAMAVAVNVHLRFPQRPRTPRLGEIKRLEVTLENLRFTKLRKCEKSQRIADERRGLADLGQDVRPVGTRPAELVHDRIIPVARRGLVAETEEERIVLARLGALRHDCERPVRPTFRMVTEEPPIEALLENRLSNLRRLGFRLCVTVHPPERLKDARPRHVRGIVHVLHIAICRAPFDEYPARQLLQKSVRIAVPAEELDELRHARLHRIHERAVARALQIVLELEDVPHRPVGDELSRRGARGIRHRQHSLRQVAERVGQEPVFEEVLLDLDAARQGIKALRRKERIAEPRRPLAAGTVHEGVERILRECVPCGGEDLVQFGVTRPRQFCRGGFGALQQSDRNLRQLEFAALGRRLQITERIRLQRLDFIFARLGEFPDRDVGVAHLERIDLAPHEQLAPVEPDLAGLRDLHLHADEARLLNAAVKAHPRTGLQP